MEKERTVLSIQNFKSLKDIKIEIKPITLLFGPNGSGKSSLLDAVSIFCNSIFGWLHNVDRSKQYVRSLDFDSLVNSENEDKAHFTIGWLHENNYNFQIRYKKIDEHTGIDSIYIEKFEKELKLWNLTVSPDEIYDIKGKLELNRLVPLYKSIGLKTFIEELETKSVVAKYIEIEKFNSFWTPEPQFIEELGPDISLKLLEYLLNRSLFTLFYPKKTRQDEELKSTLELMAITEGIEEIFNLSAEEIKETYKYSYSIIEEFIFLYNDLLSSLATFQKMEDIRKTPPDYFECISDKIINDHFGLCQFLLDLEKADRTSRAVQEQETKREKLINLIKKFELAESIEIKSIGEREPNHKYYQIMLTSGEQTFPLKNLSSGGKQILPIIMMLVLDEPQYLTMRQPELHLHPKLQTKIPEILVDLKSQMEKGI